MMFKSTLSIRTKGTRVYIGKMMFHTYPLSLYKKIESTKLKDKILKKNGYFSSGCLVRRDEDGKNFLCIPKMLTTLKGADYLIRLNGGKRMIKSYESKRIINQYHTSILGPKLCSRLRKVMFKQWLLPYKGIYQYWIFDDSQKAYEPSHVLLLNKAKKHMLQVAKDGLINIGPIVMLFNRSPYELKAMLGKSVWKKLAANATSRNRLFVDFIMRYSPRYIKKRVHFIKRAIDYHTSFLKNADLTTDWDDNVSWRGLNERLDMFNWANAEIRKVKMLTKGCRYYEFFSIYRDTMRICRQLNIQFNKQWSYGRMLKEHNQGSEQLRLLEFSTKPFTTSKRAVKQIRHDDKEAVLVQSPRQVSDIAFRFNNCLCSYIPKLIDGKAILYLIQIEKRESAIMFARYKNSWVIHEHSFAYNEMINDEFNEFGYYVKEQINKKRRKNQRAVIRRN